MTAASDATPSAIREVTVTRGVDAPPGVVFRMWTDPRHMAQWWGPRCFTNPVCEMDLRPGGAFRIVMRAPDGVDHPMTGVFHEIVKPERLVFTAVAEDAEGNPLLNSLTAVTFVERGGRTELTVRAGAAGLTAAAARMLDGMDTGWTQSLERLEEHLARAKV